MNSLFDREIKVSLIAYVLKEGININTIFPNYI